MKLPESVPTIVLELDKPRTLAFTFGAMRRIKKATGFSLDDEEAPRKLVDVMGSYIWALLVDEDRAELTEENVWQLLHPGNIDAITDAFNRLIGEGTVEKNGDGPSEGKGSP